MSQVIPQDEQVANVNAEEKPVVLTEEGDEQEAWDVETTFYFEQGLLGERDADLITAGRTI